MSYLNKENVSSLINKKKDEKKEGNSHVKHYNDLFGENFSTRNYFFRASVSDVGINVGSVLLKTENGQSDIDDDLCLTNKNPISNHDSILSDYIPDSNIKENKEYIDQIGVGNDSIMKNDLSLSGIDLDEDNIGSKEEPILSLNGTPDSNDNNVYKGCDSLKLHNNNNSNNNNNNQCSEISKYSKFSALKINTNVVENDSFLIPSNVKHVFPEGIISESSTLKENDLDIEEKVILKENEQQNSKKSLAVEYQPSSELKTISTAIKLDQPNQLFATKRSIKSENMNNGEPIVDLINEYERIKRDNNERNPFIMQIYDVFINDLKAQVNEECISKHEILSYLDLFLKYYLNILQISYDKFLNENHEIEQEQHQDKFFLHKQIHALITRMTQIPERIKYHKQSNNQFTQLDIQKIIKNEWIYQAKTQSEPSSPSKIAIPETKNHLKNLINEYQEMLLLYEEEIKQLKFDKEMDYNYMDNLIGQLTFDFNYQKTNFEVEKNHKNKLIKKLREIQNQAFNNDQIQNDPSSIQNFNNENIIPDQQENCEPNDEENLNYDNTKNPNDNNKSKKNSMPYIKKSSTIKGNMMIDQYNQLQVEHEEEQEEREGGYIDHDNNHPYHHHHHHQQQQQQQQQEEPNNLCPNSIYDDNYYCNMPLQIPINLNNSRTNDNRLNKLTGCGISKPLQGKTPDDLDFNENLLYGNSSQMNFIDQNEGNHYDFSANTNIDQKQTSRFLSPKDNIHPFSITNFPNANNFSTIEEKNSFSIDNNNSIFLGTLGNTNPNIMTMNNHNPSIKGALKQSMPNNIRNAINASRLLNKSDIDLMKDWNENLLEKVIKIEEDREKLLQTIERLIFEKQELMEKEIIAKSVIMAAEKELTRLTDQTSREKEELTLEKQQIESLKEKVMQERDYLVKKNEQMKTKIKLFNEKTKEQEKAFAQRELHGILQEKKIESKKQALEEEWSKLDIKKNEIEKCEKIITNEWNRLKVETEELFQLNRQFEKQQEEFNKNVADKIEQIDNEFKKVDKLKAKLAKENNKIEIGKKKLIEEKEYLEAQKIELEKEKEKLQIEHNEIIKGKSRIHQESLRILNEKQGIAAKQEKYENLMPNLKTLVNKMNSSTRKY